MAQPFGTFFYEDARHAINGCLYEEVVFADDLSAHRRSFTNWAGAAIQVSFDALGLAGPPSHQLAEKYQELINESL